MKLTFPWAYIRQLKASFWEVHWGAGLIRYEENPDEIFPIVGHLQVSHLSHKAYDISQLSLQLQFSPPLSILSSQTCNNLIITEISILKSASKFKRFQGGTKTPRGRQTQTQLAWSYQSTENHAKNAHWKCMTDNITDLVVNMKFMVLPSLQWPIQICVTLNSIILQDIAPWHGKANNGYYSGYTHTQQCKQLVLITPLQDRWEARLEMTMQNSKKLMFIQENKTVLWARKKLWVWVAMEIFQK